MSEEKITTVSSGVGIGTIIAFILSWTVNHSILWCIMHALCGWVYVLYWVFVYGPWK